MSKAVTIYLLLGTVMMTALMLIVHHEAALVPLNTRPTDNSTSINRTTLSPPPNTESNSQTDLMFVVVVATYRRSNNSTFGFLRNLACFLKAQTYQQWVLFVTGDAYSPEEEFRAALRSIPERRLFLSNLASPGERGRLNGHYLWLTAGTAALNQALQRVEEFYLDSRELVEDRLVIARLDDDDYWYADHLQTLADRYALYPTVKFVYTRARSCHAQDGYPQFLVDGLNNRPPVHSGMIHSTASWKLKEFWRWRYHTIEEMSSPEPGDAHMWVRMAKHMTSSSRNYSFVPLVTAIHGSENGVTCVPQPDACEFAFQHF